MFMTCSFDEVDPVLPVLTKTHALVDPPAVLLTARTTDRAAQPDSCI